MRLFITDIIKEANGNNHMRIAIFSAFPQELKYIIRNFGATRSPQKYPFPIFHATCPPHELLIVQTGMGAANAEAALHFALATFSPDAVLFAGFGGALYSAAKAGDLVWASSVIDLSRGTLTAMEIPDPGGLAEKLSRKITLYKGVVVTLSHRIKKKEITEILPPDLPYAVCDMETYPAAKFSVERGIPFFALRAVTDTLDEEIPPELFTVTDESGKYELSRALGIILSQPHLITAAITLGRNSTMAAKHLCACVKLLIETL
jgi:adenosylhomocysteine nucleosidase